MRETIPLVQLCDSASRIVSLLEKGVQTPPKYVSSEDSHRVPQDLVYRVTITYCCCQSRMPKGPVTKMLQKRGVLYSGNSSYESRKAST